MTTRRALLAYALLLGAFFSDVLFLGRSLDPSAFVQGTWGYPRESPGIPIFCNDAGAVVWAFHPWNDWVHQSVFERGEVPLWNPYQATGTPLAANFQSGVFSPMQWPYFLFTSRAWWDWLFVFRLLIAALFTFLYLRQLSIAPRLAWVGGLMFAMTGYFVDFINMNHLHVELLIPGGLFFIDRWLSQPSRLGFLGLVATLTLTVLGGAPEATFFAWLLFGSYMLWRFPTGSGRTRLFGVLAFPLSALCSALLLVPGLEYLSQSHAKHLVLSWGQVTFDSVALLGLLNPFFFGASGTLSWMEGFNRAFSSPSALGVLVILLAGFGFFSRSNLSWFFGGWLILGLMKLFGFPLISGLGRLPLFELPIYTKYLQPTLAFSAVVLAALGLHRLSRRDDVPRWCSLFPLSLAVVILSLTVYFLPQMMSHPLAKVSQAVLIWILFSVCICLSAFGLLLLWNRSPRRSFGVLLVLVIVETLILPIRVHPPEPDRSETVVMEDVIGIRMADYRVFGDYYLFPNTATSGQILDLRVLDPVLPDRFGTLMTRLSPVPVLSRVSFREIMDYEHPILDLLAVKLVLGSSDVRNLLLRESPLSKEGYIEDVSGYDLALKQVKPPFKRGFRLWVRSQTSGIRVLLQAQSPVQVRVVADQQETLLDEKVVPGQVFDRILSLGQWAGRPVDLEFELDSSRSFEAAMVPVEEGAPLLIPVEQSLVPGLRLFERPNAIPFAFMVGGATTVTEAQALDALFSSDFRPEETVYLEEPTQGLRVNGPSEFDDGKVSLIARGANRLSLELEVRKDGFLVFSQTHWPGWVCRVDGEVRPILKANYLMSAVPVKPGDQKVELVFRPLSVKLGAALSLLGAALTLVCVTLGIRRGREENR